VLKASRSDIANHTASEVVGAIPIPTLLRLVFDTAALRQTSHPCIPQNRFIDLGVAAAPL
jgi:hypothetical protein